MTAALFLADVAGAAVADTIHLAGPEGRHAAVVKRIRIGECVLLADGCGAAIGGVVVTSDPTGVAVRVNEILRVPTRRHRLVVAQALIKGERADVAVEALTEVGVSEVLAWQAARSIVRWKGDKRTKGLAKWHSIAREATKQSRRFTIPSVSFADSPEVQRRLREADTALVLHEDAAHSLSDVALPEAGEILVVVGPEGGISSDELDAFVDAGGVPVSLSDGVLRASTAGVVALAQLQLLLGIAGATASGEPR